MAYLTASEYKVLGLPAEALEGVSDSDIDAHLASVSGVIDSYLGNYALPLVAPYPEALKRCCADMTNWHIMLYRGYSPETTDDHYRLAHDACMKWLEKIASGELTLPGVVDQTPTVEEGQARVYSPNSATRGWYSSDGGAY